MSHGRGTISLLSRKVKAMKSALDAKHKLPVMNDLFDAEKERDLKKHILPHSARFPILMESLQKCTTKLKPEVLGVSLKIGNGPGSNSARSVRFTVDIRVGTCAVLLPVHCCMVHMYLYL